jgi:MFS family permease
VLVLLMLAYSFNSADRSLVPVVAQAMKLDLRLSDTQLGLLAGTAFASLYALCSLPIARLAERASRVTIITVALAAWSALTALCGAAGSFAQLLALRVGIGIGEAGCSAPAHSLISDYYDHTRRTTALSVYSCGLSLGYLFVQVVGGYVVWHAGWRSACVAVGLPGVVVALLIRRCIAEPPRGYAEGAAPERPRDFSVRAELAELGAVARTLLLRWPSAHVIAGITIASFASYGSYVFIPAYFNRYYGLDFATLGVVLGLAGSLPVAAGTLVGGAVTDALAARGARWYALVPAAGLVLATPLYLAAFAQPAWRSAALLLALAGFAQYVTLGPTFGIVQNVVATGQRATATALLYLCLTLLALAGGPPFCGWLIDRLAGLRFAHPAAGWLATAAQAFGSGAAAAGAGFRAACPGGIAPGGAAPALTAACAGALARASRQGLMLTLLLYLWAAAHYALGSIGLGRQIGRAQAGLAPAARGAALPAQVSSR